jgi:apocytochrome f
MKRTFSTATLRQPLRTLSRLTAVLVAALLLTLGADFLKPQVASAYPFWAQQNYASPREATGKIVCANCHLGKKPTEVEVPQSVAPDTVFKAVVKIPYDTTAQQVLGDGSKGGLNVGAVLMLPEGFKLAPPERISEELKEEVGDVYFTPYSPEQENIVLVGPLPGEEHQEIVFPVLSPDPATDKNIYLGKYSIHVGGNRGRGQVYPTGQKSNNSVYNATASGLIADVQTQEDGSSIVSITTAEGTTVSDTIPAGPSLLVAAGDEVKIGSPLTTDPNVGGFGQVDAEIVLQSPTRVAGLLAFFAAVMLAQILLVLKKKQVEKVQAAELNF